MAVKPCSAASTRAKPNRSLGAALWARLSRSENLRVFCPAHVTRVHPTDRSVELAISAPGTEVIEAQLVVAADGAQSAVRSAFGVAAEVRDYEQTAVITAGLPQRFHEYVAYERFTATGPMALLPLADGRCTLVLTLKPDVAKAALAWSDQEFIAEVQRRFGFRLGRFLKVGRRVPYPLSLTRSDRLSSGRCVILGNAAQGRGYDAAVQRRSAHPKLRAGSRFRLSHRRRRHYGLCHGEPAGEPEAD